MTKSQLHRNLYSLDTGLLKPELARGNINVRVGQVTPEEFAKSIMLKVM